MATVTESMTLEALEAAGRVTASINETYPIYGVSRDHAYRMAKAGQLPGCLKLGGRYVVSIPQLRRWVEGESA